MFDYKGGWLGFKRSVYLDYVIFDLSPRQLPDAFSAHLERYIFHHLYLYYVIAINKKRSN